MTTSTASNPSAPGMTGRLRAHVDLSTVIHKAWTIAASTARKTIDAWASTTAANRSRKILRQVRPAQEPGREACGPVTEFEHAREWAKENTPAFYQAWAAVYGWADTVEGDRADEKALIRHWRVNH